MDKDAIYNLLREAAISLSAADRSIPALPEKMEASRRLSDLGLDVVTLPEILDDLKSRLSGRELRVQDLLYPDVLNTLTIGDLVERLSSELRTGPRNPIVVYVDDEEENLFIFRRKYGKRLQLKTYSDPLEALAFIKASPDVALVITDEVMPNLNGNALCDAVKASKPAMKFILITGNPNNDGDLMYRTLRQNRFYEFISKPVDFEGKGEDYFNMIQSLIHFAW